MGLRGKRSNDDMLMAARGSDSYILIASSKSRPGEMGHLIASLSGGNFLYCDVLFVARRKNVFKSKRDFGTHQ